MRNSPSDTQVSGMRFDVVIIGTGFSGATLAIHLLRQSQGSRSIALIGPDAQPGRGLANSTQCSWHVLNVPAGDMSAFADAPHHFVEWARLNYDSGVDQHDFLPRSLYGQYIGSLLSEEAAKWPHSFEWLRDEARSISVEERHRHIQLSGGRRITGDKVVLALGNFPSSDPFLPGRTTECRRYFSNAWSQETFQGVDLEKDKDILLVGCGLTSIDLTIAIRAKGFGGTIHMLSRHGLLPVKHVHSPLWRASDGDVVPSARALTRFIRTSVDSARSQGVDWRAVIDSLRPRTQGLWNALPIEERRRFLRHLRPYWDVHRHRVAPIVGTIFDSQLQDGRIRTHAGWVEKYAEDAEGVSVFYRARTSGALGKLRVGRVINCSGPETNIRKVRNALVQDLLRTRLVRPNALSIGFDTDEHGALINSEGESSDFLYTLGPTRKGCLWESIAVPEIRTQITELASRLSFLPQSASPIQPSNYLSPHVLAPIC